MEELQQLRQRKIITLVGRIETPIVLTKPFYKKYGCWIRVIGDPKTDKKPNITSISKLVKGEQQAPTTLRGFRGFVKVSCVGISTEKLKQKISIFLQKRFLGNLTSEGFGKIIWEECLVDTFQPKISNRNKKFKNRKGLGINYPIELQRLLIALMLHDFVHTEKHSSKIYSQVTIKDEVIREACLNHHNGIESNNPFHHLVQYYDGLASYISRRNPHRIANRYDKSHGQINFQLLAQEIEEVQHSAYKLYNFIFHSQELSRVTEALSFGNKNLRNHLLLMVNLAINDFICVRLKLINDKKNNKNRLLIPSPTSESEAITSNVRGAEMHSILDHEQC